MSLRQIAIITCVRGGEHDGSCEAVFVDTGDREVTEFLDRARRAGWREFPAGTWWCPECVLAVRLSLCGNAPAELLR